MSRILLADHSPHAQRMGERILRDEGFEVATVTDGETALLRLKDITPDLVLADISLPGRGGYEVCEYVKTSGKYPRTRVVLTAGPVAVFDDARAQTAGSDGFVRKPFEASMLLGVVQPLLEMPGSNVLPKREPAVERALPAPQPPAALPAAPKPLEREQVRAAVILALEASMITMIENITDKVIVALEAEIRLAPPPPVPSAPPVARTGASQPKPVPPAKAVEPAPAPVEPVVRIRTPVFRTLS